MLELLQPEHLNWRVLEIKITCLTSLERYEEADIAYGISSY